MLDIIYVVTMKKLLSCKMQWWGTAKGWSCKTKIKRMKKKNVIKREKNLTHKPRTLKIDV